MNSVLLGMRNEAYGLELQAFRSVSRHVGGRRLFRAIATANRAFLARSSIGASRGLRCRNDMDIPLAYPNSAWKSSDGIILRPLYGLGFQSTKRPSGWPQFSGDMPGWGSRRFRGCFVRTIYYVRPPYYPIGNTPAVFLLQSLPPEKDANVLLLGCGDPRNILFTAYNVQDDESRRVDFTCCDIEPGVLARNVLLLSLLLDHRDGDHYQKYWNIFYHFLIDSDSLSIIHAQAQKLVELSTTIETWHGSIYGSILRMTSQDTLSELRCLWEKYSETAEPNRRQVFDMKFRDGWRKMAEYRRSVRQMHMVGVRLAEPLSTFGVTMAPLHGEYFWETGVAGGNYHDLISAKNPNPTFLYTSLGDEFNVHHGTDPVLGFHLELAYASVLSNGPFGQASGPRAKSRQQVVDRVVKVAKIQFGEWSKAFQEMTKGKKLVVRFYLGDGLHFCRTVEIHRKKGIGALSNHWGLDGGDYEASSLSPAPMSFEVIDTSNLTDHIGLLKLLIAATAVLSVKPSSVLYTETLGGSAEDQISELPRLICGDVVTMSLLLGLAPVGYMTGTIPGSSGREGFLVFRGRSPTWMVRISWKQPMSGDEKSQRHCRGPGEPQYRYRFAPKELTLALFRIYHTMFAPGEGRYTREKFAELLGLVQKRVDVSWPDVMEMLVEAIPEVRALLHRYQPAALVYDMDVQRFLAQLSPSRQSGALPESTLPIVAPVLTKKGKKRQSRALSETTLPVVAPVLTRKQKKRQSRALSKFTLPAIVTIVLTVPRSKLWGFTNARRVSFCANIQGPTYIHRFNLIQTVFGKLLYSKDGLSATIAKDVDGWEGTADLIVSFSVPTNLLAGHLNTIKVAFRPVLAFFSYTDWGNPGKVTVHESALSNSDEVSVFLKPPDISCHQSVIGSLPPPSSDFSANPDFHISNVMVCLDGDAKVETFKICVDKWGSSSTRVGEFSNGGDGPAVIQISPCVIMAVDWAQRLVFPYPVDASRAKWSVSQIFLSGPAYRLEISVPPSRITDRGGFGRQILPMVNGEPPITWDIPRVNLDRLPILDTENENHDEWLLRHLSCMYSDEERTIQDQGEVGSLKSSMKDYLAFILLSVSSIKTWKSRVFAISPPTQDDIRILIFVANVRFDLSSRTVVADARVLPLTEHIVRSKTQPLAALDRKGVVELSVDDAELKCWRGILPALVERCRDWKHAASCEYRTHGIPASKHSGESPLCSCGVGKAPQVFSKVEEWKPFEKYWTRAAIAPIFAVPYAESSVMTPEGPEDIIGGSESPGAMKNWRGLVLGRKTLVKDEKAPKVFVKVSSVGTTNAGVAGIGGTLGDISGCQNCKKKLQAGILLVCKGCGKVCYCSVACQRDNWKRHRRVCKR